MGVANIVNVFRHYREDNMIAVCEICGKKKKKKGNVKCCCEECSKEALRRRQEKYRIQEKVEKEYRVCEICESIFKALPTSKRTTCCSRCKQLKEEYDEVELHTFEDAIYMRESKLIEINTLARNQGLSYGQLQAKKWLEDNKIKC